MKDYYEVLGIRPDSNISEIKVAYRQLALEYHPDRNSSPNASEKFIEITEAYDVLRNTKKRKKYDKRYQNEFDSQTKNDIDFKKAYREWKKESHKRASQDAEMAYDEFATKIARELKIGVSYIPNLIAMLIAGGSSISCLVLIGSAADDLGAGGNFMLLLTAIGLMGVTYKLFVVARSDFQHDRADSQA
jgi:hypothetical protein